MKISYACGFAASLALSGLLTGCYTQLYTQGYASRTLDAPASENAEEAGYARAPETESDTLTPGDSALAAGERDTAARGTVVVNNYYRESPYYRGYLVDEWEYPTLSLGFYSSRYRDYNGAYWWSGPGYSRNYYRGYHRGYHRGYTPSYPSAGGGSPGPYTSDKRLYSNPPQRVTKGHRSSSGNSVPAPAPKQSAESTAPKAEAAPVNPPADDNGSSGSNSSDSDDQKPKPSKGRRR